MLEYIMMITSHASTHPGDNPGANLMSISHRCHPILVAFVWELTEETIHLPLGCLQGGDVRWKAAEILKAEALTPSVFFFVFFTLVAGPRRSLCLKLSVGEGPHTLCGSQSV